MEFRSSYWCAVIYLHIKQICYRNNLSKNKRIYKEQLCQVQKIQEIRDYSLMFFYAEIVLLIERIN